MRQDQLWWALLAAVFLLIVLAIPGILHLLALILVIGILVFVAAVLRPAWFSNLRRKKRQQWPFGRDATLLCAILIVLILVLLFAH